jgi:hypothetical protein
LAAVGLSFIAFILLWTLPGWHTETDETGDLIDVKPFPSQQKCSFILLFLGLAVLSLLISAIWQHAAAASATALVKPLSQGQLVSHVGPAAIVLGWMTVLTMMAVFVGVWIMILSLGDLDTLLISDAED